MSTKLFLYKAAAVLILAALLLCVPSLPAQAAPASEPAALNNGLALTPPMGWNSWNKFGCNVTDALVRQMADAMVSSGMAAAGYKYIVIDDCWQSTTRTNGHVNLDPDFPNMKALADYVHSKGLKFGLYSDRGTATCAGRAGSYGHEITDAQDYASWGVDYLKYDNCNPAAGSNIQADYTRMRDALAATGRPIVFSICAWHYESWMPSVGNLWRTTGDIWDGWNGMIGLPDTNNQSASVAGPGGWNDPDMLEVGNGGMTDTEYRTHMSLWAIMAAPLISGNDLRNMSQATKDILMAPEILAVDQDPLGKQGTRVWTGGSGNWLNVWSKQLSGTNVRAVALFNGTTSAANITVSWSQIGLPAGSATVRDLWARADRGSFNNSYTVNVPAHGTVMLKIASGGTSPTPTPTPVTPTPVTPTPVTSTPTTPTPVTPTPVTPTPTPGSSTPCSPVTGTVSAPFSYDGAGTFCWQIASIPNYINSWNLTSLKINGVDFSNIYAVPSNLPPKINGFWYVSYSGQYPWSHFEAK
jgi:alpha-galactosidase